MCSDYTKSALMYVDYGGDAYAGMGIKAMKSFGRSRGRNLKDRVNRSHFVSLQRDVMKRKTFNIIIS